MSSPEQHQAGEMRGAGSAWLLCRVAYGDQLQLTKGPVALSTPLEGQSGRSAQEPAGVRIGRTVPILLVLSALPVMAAGKKGGVRAEKGAAKPQKTPEELKALEEFDRITEAASALMDCGGDGHLQRCAGGAAARCGRLQGRRRHVC